MSTTLTQAHTFTERLSPASAALSVELVYGVELPRDIAAKILLMRHEENRKRAPGEKLPLLVAYNGSGEVLLPNVRSRSESAYLVPANWLSQREIDALRFVSETIPIHEACMIWKEALVDEKELSPYISLLEGYYYANLHIPYTWLCTRTGTIVALAHQIVRAWHTCFTPV